jgi:hypothetical protein
MLRLKIPFASMREDVQMTFKSGQTTEYHDATLKRDFRCELVCGQPEYVRITPLQEDFDPFEVELLED